MRQLYAFMLPSTKLSLCLEMDRVLRVRGYIFLKFLPHQPRIDKNYQTLKKIEGLIIFRTCLKLYGWISVLKNDILKPIEK